LGLEHRRPGEFAGRSDALTSSTLAGRRLFVARVGWLAVTFLAVGLFLASIPAHYEAIVSYSDPSFEPETVRATLEASGVSIRFYALCLLSIGCVSTVVWVVVAAVIFWRRSDNWIALFASLSLITFGTMSLPPGPPVLADQSFAVWLPINVLALIGTVALYVFYLHFPNGRFVPRWTR
jgi:uncharacterized membrane protein YbaN (DUF454 family)